MKFSQPTPELSVPDVRAAQAYYRDHLGFEIAWHNTEGKIGAVSHGDCAIFFRETLTPAQPSTFWIYTDDVDAAHKDLAKRSANITQPPSHTSWGMHQFTVKDPYGNTFYFHHDL